MDNPPQPLSPQVANTSNGWLKNSMYSTALVIFILAAFGGGFFTGRNTGNLKTSSNIVPKEQIATNPLIDSKPMAVIAGKITKVSGKTLSITNNKGVSGEIEASERAVISKPAAGGPSSGSDLNSIELNKEVTLTVEVNGGLYEVVSIIYPPTPVPPTSTPSAQLKSTR